MAQIKRQLDNRDVFLTRFDPEPEFIILGYTEDVNRTPSKFGSSGITLDVRVEDYPYFCDYELGLRDCSPLFPYSATGNVQNSPDEEFYGAAQNNKVHVRNHSAHEYGLMNLPISQSRQLDPEANQWYSPEHVYTGSLGEWVTGPWIRSIQQETYKQYNRPLTLPWEK